MDWKGRRFCTTWILVVQVLASCCSKML